MARVIAVATMTAAVALVLATGAQAGQYYVYACSSYGNTAPAFTGYSNTSDLNTADDCMQPAPGGGDRSLEINNPAEPVVRGYGANWTAYSPSPAIAIVGAYTPLNTVFVDCNLHKDGFEANYLWSGGTQQIDHINVCNGEGYGYGTGIDSSFGPSSYFGWGAGCWLLSSCTSSSIIGAVLGVQGVRLTAEENTPPALLAVPSSNLWYASGWARGAWPITLDATDPSGVCSLGTSVDGQTALSWSDSSPDTSSFTQCHGSQLPGQLNTTNYTNGPHTLGYEASNAAGVTAAPSEAIHIDNAPVSLSLTGPTDALSTAGTQSVTASAAAGPSGVQAILCSLDGGSYRRYTAASARVAVSGLGQHRVNCYAQNNALDAGGQPASSPPAQWNLIIRQPTVAAISLSRTVDGLRCRRVAERVRVAGHWVTIRRHHKRVRRYSRARVKSRRVTRCHLRTALRREVVWATVERHGKQVRVKRVKFIRVALPPQTVGDGVRHVAFGRGTTVSGWVGLADGTALSGTEVEVVTAPDNGSGDFSQAALVTTSSNGAWSASLPAGPSRLVEAVYPGSSTEEPATSTSVQLIVPAKILLRVKPTQTNWGSTIRITGRVLGGYIPSGKLLRLRIGISQIRETVGIPDLAADGRFQTTWTFAPGHGLVRYWFSVSTLPEADYPYAPASSGRVTVTVGP